MRRVLTFLFVLSYGLVVSTQAAYQPVWKPDTTSADWSIMLGSRVPHPRPSRPPRPRVRISVTGPPPSTSRALSYVTTPINQAPMTDLAVDPTPIVPLIKAYVGCRRLSGVV